MNFADIKYSKGILRIAISIIATIAYTYMGGAAKLFVFPYVVFLVLKNDIDYFPALIVQLIAETFTIYIILFACVILTIINIRKLIQSDIKWIVILLLSIIPYIIWHFCYRVIFLHIPIIEAMDQYFLFLGIFPFFYGMLLSKQFTTGKFKELIIFLFIAFLYSNIVFIRILFFLVPFFFTYSFYSLYLNIKGNSISLFSIFSIVTLLLCLRNFATFTLILTSIYATLLVFIYFRKWTITINLSTGIIPFIFIFIFMIYAMNNYKKNEDKFDLDSKITLQNSIERASAKAFEDRAPYWKGALDGIISEHNILIPFQINNVVADVGTEKSIEITFGSHTLFLELIRQYGIPIGLLLNIIFIILAIKIGGILRIENIQHNYIILACVTLSIFSIGSMNGTFPLQGNFSLLMMSTAGMCYGITKRKWLMKRNAINYISNSYIINKYRSKITIT